jgi:hypothetical protein
MLSVCVGDLVRMKPKYYGDDINDQWVGITGVVLEIIEADGSGTGVNVLVQHPDEPSPIPIFAFLRDVEKICCEVCGCDPCDCHPWD